MVLVLVLLVTAFWALNVKKTELVVYIFSLEVKVEKRAAILFSSAIIVV